MILIAGLTPAWQQILCFDSLTLGEVNRAHEVHWCASGKVLNAARALHHLGGPGKALTIVGGATGEQIRRDAARLGFAARWIEGARPPAFARRSSTPPGVPSPNWSPTPGESVTPNARRFWPPTLKRPWLPQWSS